MEQIDFFAVGDIVTEPFIRLKEASVHCNINNDTCEICMRWGDKIPYEFFVLTAAVGNASNAAVCAARLGLRSSLRAYLGKDRYGEGSLEVLKNERVDTTYIVTDPARPSNYHYVLWYETERTILVKHEEYDYMWPNIPVPPKWTYLSSLAQNSLQYHLEMARWLEQHPETKLAFQPGTFQMKLGTETLRNIYENTEIFFCNKEEAQRILKTPDTHDNKQLLENIAMLGPKLVVITDDRKGAYARTSTGEHYHVPMYPDTRPPYERTGAGDAFAATVTTALALGLSFEEALLWGPINSMSVVQEVGAHKGLLTRDALEQFLKNKPEEYKLTELG